MALRIGMLLAVAAAVLAASAAAGPDPLTQAALDGCTRDRSSILTKQVPNWVYVGDKDAPATGSPPPFVTASGVASAQYEPDLSAHPTGVDDPLTHTSYDFVFNLRVDAQYASLLGGSEADKTGNYAGTDEESARLHIERESGTFPVFAWPDRGDPVTVSGSWVWDCDHASPTGERTEIHPFHSIWVERRPSPRSPSGDSEGDLFVTSARTPADDQALCAHKTKGDRAAFHSCLATATGEVDVNGLYSYVLRAPPRPSPKARLVYRVVDRGSSGAPPLQVSPGASGITVSARIDAPPNSRVVLAKQVFVGWRPVPSRARPVHLRVRLLSLLVRRAMDPGCPPFQPDCPFKNESTLLGQVTKPPGEWNVYVNAGGVWAPWKPLLLLAHDGQVIASRQRIDFYVARGAPWRLFVQTRECDFGSLGNAYSLTQPVWPCPLANEIGNTVGDDVPGIVADHFRSSEAGLGVHRSNSELAGSTCPASNVHGCYQLRYQVTRIRVSSRH
jgi:hypothetical protein